jgi:hypothetical protein
MFRFAKEVLQCYKWIEARLAMRRALVLLFLTLTIEAASAQSTGRDPGRDDALNAAIVVSAGIDAMFRRLSLCNELDTRNSATYIFVSAEYLRDASVRDAIDRTEHLMDAEVRSLAGNPEKAKAIRKQEMEKFYQKRRQQALAAPGPFQQDCRQLAQIFSTPARTVQAPPNDLFERDERYRYLVRV